MSSTPVTAQDYLALPAPQTARGDSRRSLLLGGLLILAVLSIGVIFLEFSARDQEAEILRGTELRLKLSADGRAQVLAEWLDGRIARARPIAESDLFALFATEVDLGGADSMLQGPLAEQLPYMQAAMAEFARQGDLAGAYLLSREGRAYLTSPEAPPLDDRARRAAQRLFPRGQPTVLPLEASPDSRLRLDILVPLRPPQAQSAADAERTVGVLLMTTMADARLADALAPSPVGGQDERPALLQVAGGQAVLVRPGAPQPLVPLTGDWPATLGTLEFAARPLAGGGEGYSAGVAVAGAPWLVLEQIPAAAVLAPLRTHRLFGGLVVGLATIGFAAAAMAFWWRQGSENNLLLAQQYHELAARLQTQRQLLDSINSSIQEQISVKDRDGAYIFVNPPFAEAVGLPAQSVLGLTDASLFEAGVARVTAELDGLVLRDGRRVERGILMRLADRLRYLQVAKSPFQDDGGRTIGVVSVARDVTDLMEAQQRRDQAVMNTIRALSNTVEAVDPYLSGHSRKLERISSGLARRLGCSDMEVQTLEIAANLSQIGKLSVPPEILTKSERLSAEEQAIMRQHIEQADRILSELDFGLPVREVLLQMHERLDGSGYPRGLGADEIGLAGRILAVADVFAARTTPRSYREAIPAETALAFLAESSERYDTVVIEALGELLAEPDFHRALEQLDSA